MADLPAAPPSPAEAEDLLRKRKRLTHTLQQKIDIVLEVERLVYAEKTKTLKGYCREHELDLDPSQVRRWKNNISEMKRTLDRTTRKKTKVACTKGRPSRLESIRDKLMPWVENMLAQNKVVRVREVAIRAKRWDRGLRRMNRYTVFAIVRRWLRSNGIVTRTVTHKAQEDPKDMDQMASKFLASTRPLISQPNRHQHFILNMDQVPFKPQESSKRTLAKKGAKSINAKEIKTGVGRITALVCVAADGTKLPPLIVYKAKPNGTVQREFKHFPKECKYIVQENAWTDEQVMLYWVDNVLKPYVSTAPRGIIPYLLLDKYKCHYQGSVAHEIENMGVEWDIIPGGCTGLIQPVDVGIGKPWKGRMRNQLEDWLRMQTNTQRITPKETRRLIAEWAVASWSIVHEDVVYNAWRHDVFSYFPDEPTKATTFVEEECYYSSSDEEECEEILEYLNEELTESV